MQEDAKSEPRTKTESGGGVPPRRRTAIGSGDDGSGASRVLQIAQQESRRLGHNFVGSEQILLGLIGEDSGIAAQALKSMGLGLREARVEVEKLIGRGSGFVAVEIPFTPRAKRVLEFSWDEARKLGHKHIDTEHLLLGLVHEGDGVAVTVLKNLDLDLANVHKQVITLLGKAADHEA